MSSVNNYNLRKNGVSVKPAAYHACGVKTDLRSAFESCLNLQHPVKLIH